MNRAFLFGKILITGGIVLGLELASSRILTPFFGVSLYVWSGILSVTLLALALGYKGGGILAARISRENSLAVYAGAGAMSALWLLICLWTYPFIFWPLAKFDLVAGSILACLYVLFIPLVILSGLNPLLVSLLTNDADKGDRGAGHVFFVSTIGSVLGVFIVAYGMLPFLTNYMTIAILTIASTLLSLAGFYLLRSQRRVTLFISATLVILFIALATLLSGGLERFARTASFQGVEWKVVEASPSSFGNLKMVDIADTNGNHLTRMLVNDGMTQNVFNPLGQPTGLYTYALERLALAASPDAQKALVLGIGAGTIPANFAADGMQVHAVDINRGIVDFSRRHLGLDDTGITMEIADARTATRNCDHDNDIVSVDLFHDDGTPEHLVTREFFSDIKNCLKDRGVMVMNTFMSTTDRSAENALLQTIASVFGEIHFSYQPRHDDVGLTSAFIVARKGGPVGALELSYNNMPPGQAQDLRATMETSCTYVPNDRALDNAPILTDISNQWKNLSHVQELGYRKAVIGFTPWQVLLN